MGEDLLSPPKKFIQGLLFNASNASKEKHVTKNNLQRKENMYRFLLMTTTAKAKIMLIN